MNCWLCNRKIEPTNKLLATTLHFWAKCCTRCTEVYGERNEAGQLTYKDEGKSVQ